jgi:hypothetical protein
MNNQFDVTNYPDDVPAELVAGYRWAWTRSEITAVYPTDLYTLIYRFQKLDDPSTTWEVSAGKVANAHVVEITGTDSVEYLPGDYEFIALIKRDSDSAEVHVESGYAEILPSFEYDGDSANWTYQVLTAVRAALKGTASSDQLEIEVAGRRIVRRTATELLALEQEFSRRWQKVKDDRAKANGKSVRSTVLIKMGA